MRLVRDRTLHGRGHTTLAHELLVRQGALPRTLTVTVTPPLTPPLTPNPTPNPNPTHPTPRLCPLGKINQDVGASECVSCAVGKLSSADRTSCGDW